MGYIANGLRTLGALLLFALPFTGNAAPEDGDVLVFGGTGQLGSEVVKALVASGHSVTVFARPNSDRGRIADLDVAYIVGDVLEEADVKAAFETAKFRVVIDALGRKNAPVSFYTISGRYLAKWAADTGVQQAILHGSVGAGSSMATYPTSRRSAMQATMEAKTDAENALIDSGVDYTIIRNARLPGTGRRARARRNSTQTS